MVSWAPESFYAMLGEFSRKNMTNPERRMAQRKFLAAGFTDRAVAGYLDQVRGRGGQQGPVIVLFL
jgi:cytochrome P450